MIKFIKKLIGKYKNAVHVDRILKEYEVILFLIKDSYTMQDFIYCKKKIYSLLFPFIPFYLYYFPTPYLSNFSFLQKDFFSSYKFFVEPTCP